MKIMILALMAILSLAPRCVGAAVTEVPSMPFGSTSNLEQYAIRTVNRVAVYAWMTDTNGVLVGLRAGSEMKTYSTKPALDGDIAAHINAVLTVIANTTDPRWNKSADFAFEVSCFFSNGQDLSADLLSIPFFRGKLDRTTNGYAVPVSLPIRTELPNSVPFWIPGLKWARIEGGNVGEGFPSEVLDGDLDPSTDPVDLAGFLNVPIVYFSDPKFWGRLYIDNGVYAKFDESGRQVAKDPFVATMSKDSGSANGSVVLKVLQGDPGTAYRIETSSDLVSWTNFSSVNIVDPFHGTHRQFSISTGGSSPPARFFRVIGDTRP